MSWYSLLLFSIPLWFVAGFDFIIYFFIALFLFLIRPQANLKTQPIDFLIIFLILVLACSAGLAYLVGRPPSRVLAAAYNLSNLIMGLILMQQMRYSLSHSVQNWTSGMAWHNFLRASIILYIFTFGVIIVTAVYVVVFGQHVIFFRTLFGSLVQQDLPGLVGLSQVALFVRTDWGTGIPVPRLNLFSPYPTSGAFIFAVLGHFALIYIHRYSSNARIWGFVVVVSLILGIAATTTRSILGGFFVGWGAATVMFGSPGRRTALVCAAALLTGGLLLADTKFEQLFEYRSASTNARMDNYKLAVDIAMEKGPMLGIGIKPRDEAVQEFPIGSHSTLVSAFVKGGTIGLGLAFTAFYVFPLFMWLRIKQILSSSRRLAILVREEAIILFRLQCITWVFLVFQDVDSVAAATFCLFVSFAYVQAWGFGLGLQRSTVRAATASSYPP